MRGRPRKLKRSENGELEWRVFAALFDAKRPMTVTELSRTLNVRRQTLYFHLDKFRAMGLVLCNNRKWMCQPLFIDGKALDITLTAYELLIKVVVDRMTVEPEVKPAEAVRGILVGLVHLYEGELLK